MTIDRSMVILIIGCSLVTWFPRIMPFILAKTITFPKWLIQFLNFLPICILTALLFQSILINKEGFPSFDIEKTLALIPTLTVSIVTKSLMKTVIVGVASIAIIRYLI